jgi:hypothetical protein
MINWGLLLYNRLFFANNQATLLAIGHVSLVAYVSSAAKKKTADNA